MKIGEIVRNARVAKGLSQKQLAKEINSTEVVIRLLEDKNYCSPMLYRRLAKFFHILPHEITKHDYKSVV